jgi:hypothetical protein
MTVPELHEPLPRVADERSMLMSFLEYLDLFCFERYTDLRPSRGNEDFRRAGYTCMGSFATWLTSRTTGSSMRQSTEPPGTNPQEVYRSIARLRGERSNWSTPGR